MKKTNSAEQIRVILTEYPHMKSKNFVAQFLPDVSYTSLNRLYHSKQKGITDIENVLSILEKHKRKLK